MNSAVECAIKCIRERYCEPLTIADLASSAILSKYHFCRTFSRATGVSPGRFLSAVRIYQAKRLLLSTSMNVTDISFAVGFSSLGSFTNHFTQSVGVSPGRFRRMAQQDRLELLRRPHSSLSPAARVTGTVMLPKGFAIASVYVGAFQGPILQGWPSATAVLPICSLGQWQAYDLQVPPGEWFVHAVAVADTIDPEPWSRRVLLVARSGPVPLVDGAAASVVISLRPVRPTDLPILFALPDLEAMVDEISDTGELDGPVDAAIMDPAGVLGRIRRRRDRRPRPRATLPGKGRVAFLNRCLGVVMSRADSN
jgi:AraC family transcriptional regulator